MQSTNIPSKIPLPFANSAGSSYKNTIPVASQIGITNGKASLTDGFPPLTFQAISSGGVPPFGADFNGILNEITAIQQWQNAGGFFPYDSAFSTAIGGYPKGAILQAASFGGLWVSTLENNTSNPDTGGAGWTSLAFEGSQAITVTSADVTVSQLQSAYPVIIVSGTLTAARNLIFPAIVGEWIVQNNTTGAFTLTAKTASGTGVTLTQGQSTYVYGDGTNILFADSSKVASFNGRVGAVTLNATDVTSALGYTPYNSTNPNNYAPASIQGQVFTSTGTFTIPTGVSALKVTLLGGGGGGAGDDGNAGSSGGAGGAVIAYLNGLTPGATLSVASIGNGGNGSPAITGSSGGTGGSTTVSSGTQTISTLTATGGAGGVTGGSGGGGVGGSGSGGSLNLVGGGGSKGTSSVAQAGGSSIFGGGGNSYAGSYGGNGNNGGGGGGAQGAGNIGGNGGNGLVIFEW